MKNRFAILIVFILALNPVLASASEPEPSENLQPTQVTENESNPQPQLNNEPVDPVPIVEEPTIPSTETPTVNNEQNIETPKDVVPKDENDNDTVTAEEPSADDETTDDSEEDENDTTKDELKDDGKKEHVHSFKYISNDDGTHTVKCTEMVEPDENSDDASATECTYEEIEVCEYNEEGICIHCGYKMPEEVKEFAPSMSFSISNQSFTMGGANPVISVNISQEEYDIEYAQVCFANYGSNQFINVGLARGQYYDFQNDKFVYTSNDCWCASCDITSDYSSGTYSLRSIYARSTSGETIHYSVESHSLPEEYQNVSISLNMDRTTADVRGIIDKPIVNVPEFYNTTEEISNHVAIRPEPVPEVALEIPTRNIDSVPSQSDAIAEAAIEEEPEEEIEDVIEQETIKKSINDSIVTREEQATTSSNSDKQKDDTKKQTAQSQQSSNAQKETQQSPISHFFDNVFSFMKNLFKWW